MTLHQLLLAAPALADTATPEPPASPPAQAIDDIFLVILGVTDHDLRPGRRLAARTRRSASASGPATLDPPQTHGSTKLEIGWTIVPILIVLGLAGYTAYKMPDTVDDRPSSMVIHVLAQQFSWTFDVPGRPQAPEDGRRQVHAVRAGRTCRSSSS